MKINEKSAVKLDLKTIGIICAMVISVRTNSVANIALQSLSDINFKSKDVAESISSGRRVNSAKKDASTFSIAQIERAKIRSLTSIIQGLNQAKGISQVAIAGAEAVSNLFIDLKEQITRGENPGNTPRQQAIIQQDYASTLQQMRNVMTNTIFQKTNILIEQAIPPNGTNVFSAFVFTLQDVGVQSNIEGDTFYIRGQNLDVLVGIMEDQNVSSVANAQAARAI